MRGSSFGYLIRVGVRSVFKNRLMSFASIGVLMACMLLIGSAGMLSLNVNSIVGYVEDQNEVMVFADDNLDEDELQNLDLDLHSLDNIRDIQFISREQTLEEFNQKSEEGLGFEEGDNPFPNAFRLSVDDLSRLSETVEKLQGLEGVIEVNAPTDIASTIVSVKQAVYIGGSSIVLILAIVALIIIANTIKITVFNRRKEINIMKFVGATDMFIKLPFFVEGMVLGLLAASLAFFILWGGYEYLVTWMDGNQSALFMMFKEQIIPFESIALMMYGAFAAGGVLIGVGGSMIFVRKYLRV